MSLVRWVVFVASIIVICLGAVGITMSIKWRIESKKRKKRNHKEISEWYDLMVE